MSHGHDNISKQDHLKLPAAPTSDPTQNTILNPMDILMKHGLKNN